MIINANDAATLKALGGISIERIWNNASPSSSFAAQSIYQDNSEYNFAIVQFAETAVLVRAGYYEVATYISNASNAPSSHSSRTVKFYSGRIEFGNCHAKNITSGSAGGEKNTNLIPLAVYGIKGVTF